MARQKRTNLLLPPDLKERVEAKAKVKRIPAAQHYRRLLELGEMLDDAQSNGGRLVIEGIGKRREIVVV